MKVLRETIVPLQHPTPQVYNEPSAILLLA